MHHLPLGSLKMGKKSFDHCEKVVEEFIGPKFSSLNPFQKQLKIAARLLELIEASSSHFLLREVADFLSRIEAHNIFPGFTINVFETFLNHYLEIDEKRQYRVRAKIVGKHLPRGDYQVLFPIGMDKVYEGPHYVTAHASPDLDTMVASFWGWVDAFGARVSTGCHFWNLPGGAPKELVEKRILFTDLFGESFFHLFSKDKNALSITGFDLFTQKGLKVVDQHALLTDLEESTDALIVTHDDGRYLADWKGNDAENFRRITSAIFSVLRAFDAGFQHQIIQVFSRRSVHRYEVKEVVDAWFFSPILSNDAFKDLSSQLKHHVHLFCQEVLGIELGVRASFSDFLTTILSKSSKAHGVDFDDLKRVYAAELFDEHEQIVDDRTKILTMLDHVVKILKQMMEVVRQVFASFYFAIKTKKRVYALQDSAVTFLSDLEEIKARMEAHPFITVNLSDDQETTVPLGVIYAHELQKPTLGTVTCRDFSNREETKIPGYFEVIAGLDHHKTAFNSTIPMTLKIMDVQSANTLVAEAAFLMNDKASKGGMTEEEIDRALAASNRHTPSACRIHSRLLNRKMNCLQPRGFVDAERELLEYTHFFFAILDDTDLLSKVTWIDIKVMAELVNRMKSLQLKNEVEVIHFDDLDPYDGSSLKKAAARLMQHEEVFSLYRTVYQEREKAVEKHLKALTLSPTFPMFEDTKVQNGCARVGQKKLYSSNIAGFSSLRKELLDAWAKESLQVFEKNSSIDLHLLMISTVASCEDLYQGSKASYSHQDELWFFVPDKESALVHLKLFLTQFQRNKMIVKHQESLRITVYGKKTSTIRRCFEESFLPCAIEEKQGIEHLVVLHHAPGILNSRKTMISPFLPLIG